MLHISISSTHAHAPAHALYTYTNHTAHILHTLHTTVQEKEEKEKKELEKARATRKIELARVRSLATAAAAAVVVASTASQRTEISFSDGRGSRIGSGSRQNRYCCCCYNLYTLYIPLLSSLNMRMAHINTQRTAPVHVVLQCPVLSTNSMITIILSHVIPTADYLLILITDYFSNEIDEYSTDEDPYVTGRGGDDDDDDRRQIFAFAHTGNNGPVASEMASRSGSGTSTRDEINTAWEQMVALKAAPNSNRVWMLNEQVRNVQVFVLIFIGKHTWQSPCATCPHTRPLTHTLYLFIYVTRFLVRLLGV